MFLESILYVLSKIVFFTGSVLKKTSFPKPLTKEEEKEAIKKVKNGDKEAKDLLITHNLRLVSHIVKKYSGAYETEDLISVGTIGLIKAVNTFEPEKNTAFATFASRCIENEILMLLRSDKKHKNDVSLYSSIGEDKDGNELTLMDLLCDKEDEVFSKVDRSIESEKFSEFIKGILDKREYTVICLRYGLKGATPKAQREVANFLRISRSYISRIEKKAVEKLKEAVKKGQFYC